MPKPVSLKARRVTINACQAAWRLNVPASLSDNGKRQQLFFSTQRLADAKADELKTRAHNARAGLVNLRAPQIVDVNESYALLSEFPDINLRDAALHYRNLLRARANSIPFRQLFDLYLALIQNKSDAHRIAMRQTRDRFPSLDSALTCDITPETLDQLLLGLPPASRDLILRHWRSVFRYGQKRGYLAANPIARLDFAGRERKEVEIYEVGSAETLLADALSNGLALLPYYVFGFFCGIRPEDELHLLDWRYVHLDARRHVAIPAAISKVHRYREVELSQNAVAWLREYAARGGVMTGKAVPWKIEGTRRHRRASCERVGIKWLQDGMRHSYISYWLALHHDKDKVMMMAGHTDPNTLDRHYNAGVPRVEAKKFWAIRPPKRNEKIIPFAAAAA